MLIIIEFVALFDIFHTFVRVGLHVYMDFCFDMPNNSIYIQIIRSNINLTLLNVDKFIGPMRSNYKSFSIITIKIATSHFLYEEDKWRERARERESERERERERDENDLYGRRKICW